MRQLYITFSNQKWSTLSTKSILWSHYTELLTIKDINKIDYYISLILVHNFSIRELREIIKNKEYERLDEDTKRKLINKTDKGYQTKNVTLKEKQ